MQNVSHKEGSDMTNDHQTGDAGHGNQTASSSSSTDKTKPPSSDKQDLFLDLCPSDEDEASEVESFAIDQDELDDDDDTSRFLLSNENLDEDGEIRTVDPETQARLEALLEAAGIGKLSTADGKAFADPEVLRRLTSSVSCALDEAAAALTRMRAEQQAEGAAAPVDSTKTLAQACSSGDIGTVRQLLDEGRSVHETTEEGESLLSLACSAGYYELAQVLLAMRANVEDRGIKGDCTPLMEAASGGYVDIVKLLTSHEADVAAQSSAGNTPLHYAACGGHEEVVRVLIEMAANVEEHNENGHTPLMEAASAGHVGVAKLLLNSGAGINTHSNEFKESALTLACYKGHLEMVKFLLEAGADHEHKTDEMHTALMEACMDGHVEVARLLLDSGAQVNMPIDSFESPLTLAACGGHVELANLLIERGANLEEVNDEGYTPLMEASREGHEEMVALLLAHGADINGQTEETQETALTLACCGGFQEVADFLIKAGADMELGCSSPLMEAAQEGHLELVKYLIKASANVHSQTQTGDTALTYACENGHTDVAEVLLEANAEMEHESEGGRTPLMKAARAGHLCTVQFLISRGADVNRATSTNDHTVLSLACAGGHLPVVELLLRHGSDCGHKMKDGSTMLIEAAKGGHTQVVNLLLDWPTSILSPTPDNTNTNLSPPQTLLDVNQLPRVPMHGLANIVPPQDPNKTSGAQGACATAAQLHAHAQQRALMQQVAGVQYTQPTATASVPGELNLGELNMSCHSFDESKQNMKAALSAQKKRVTTNNGDVFKDCITTSPTQPVPHPAVDMPSSPDSPSPGGAVGGEPPVLGKENKSNNANGIHSSKTESPPRQSVEEIFKRMNMAGQMCDEILSHMEGSQVSDNDSELELTFADGCSPIPLELESTPDMKASERLEAFINKMMQKAELLNTTREEQILKKQQILEELQKVGNLLLDSVPKVSTRPQPQGGATCSPDDHSLETQPSANVEQELQEKAKLHMILNAQQQVETELLREKQRQLQDIERLKQGSKDPSSDNELEPCSSSSHQNQRAHLQAQKSSTDSESAFDSREVPKPPSEVSSLDRDGENLDDIYAYDTDEEDYDDDEEDRVTDVDEEMLGIGNAECYLAQGFSAEQIRECEERLNQAVMEQLDQRFSETWRLNAAAVPLTCAPNPVPLHIALKNDLQTQLQLGLSSASNMPTISSEITRMANESSMNIVASSASGPLAEEDEEPTPADENLPSNFDIQTRPKLAKQESLSSVNSDVEDGCSASDPQQTFQGEDGDSLVPPEGTSVDPTPLYYFTPPTGSPERASSSESMTCHSQESSRASSEEVDLSNVMPAVEPQLQHEQAKLRPPLISQQLQLLTQQLQQHQLLQQRLAIAKDRRLSSMGTLYGNSTSVIVPNPQQLQQLQKLMIPVQLEPLTAQAITPANAAAIQQQLEQQRQQLQLILQQQLQHELQQQLKLQQEHEQLKQQLEQHQAQVAMQQQQLQAQTNKMKGNQVKIQQASQHISTTTNSLDSLQQEINQQELQQLKLQQVQQHLQQLHQQLQQVQQLQNNHQLTQQELLQQAQHLQQQLQAAQLQQFTVQGQPLHASQVAAAVQTTGIVSQPMQVNVNQQQMAQLLSQPDLLQQAQHLQRLAEVQRQQNQLHNMPLSMVTNTNITTGISAVTTMPVTVATNQVNQVNINNVVTNNVNVCGNINVNSVNNLNVKVPNGAQAVKKKKKHNLFNQQQQQLQQQPLDAHQLQQHQLQQLQVLQQQQLQQQFQQQQQLYQLQQQQYEQQIGQQQQAQILNNPQLAQQIVDYSQTVANNTGIPPNQLYNYYLDLVNNSPPSVTPVTPNPSPASPQVSPTVYPSVELDAQTESNHDTALTLACAGGHAELVSLLLSRGAEIEHRDKKGFTPLILAATAGHADVCTLLLEEGADLESQSDRTKDTALSLACSGGRYEVVELLLQRGANKEHRNVSDYTPLSLAASGGYVNIIKLLLSYNAEINSRTGSKLGISPLMLAAMNGHTAAVKLLLDMGSDINAQIETNRNTALTLACFQGRHEVVSLLVDRKANIEHRAKTGLTPLMEAASGGYVEVGRVLLDKGADVNASPVPSSKDTALTIAADKGHFRFVELLINKGAAIDVRNKKGNSPLWLACNGGHLDVAQLLVNAKADVDSQDNRKVSCLMAAFRKGHVKCVKWMVKHVTQFPSDQECMRFIQTVTDKELLKKCHQCMEIIVSAKDRQAAEANKNASILLEEIDAERSREETKRERAARKREKRRQKKKEKQEKEEKERVEKEGKEVEDLDEGDCKEEFLDTDDLELDTPEPEPVVIAKVQAHSFDDKENKKNKHNRESPAVDLPDLCTVAMTSLGTNAGSQGNTTTNNKNKKKKKGSRSQTAAPEPPRAQNSPLPIPVPETQSSLKTSKVTSDTKGRRTNIEAKSKSSNAAVAPSSRSQNSAILSAAEKKVVERNNSRNSAHSSSAVRSNKKSSSAISTTGIGDLDDFGALPSQMSDLKISQAAKKEAPVATERNKATKMNKKLHALDNFDMISPMKSNLKATNTPSPKKGGSKREQEGWKEVIRRSKKIVVPANAVTRVIGRQGVNVNAIKEVSGANIEIDRAKGGDRTLTIKGPADATKRAYDLLSALIKDPDKEVEQIIPKLKKVVNTNTLTISSNVWHNSMANSLSSTASQSSAPVPQAAPLVKPSTTVTRMSSATTVTITTSASRPAANGGKSTLSQMGTFQAANGTAIWGNPGQPPANLQRQNVTLGMFSGVTSTVSYIADKSPSIVSRNLFPPDGNESPQQASSANMTATYSSPSMAKTKLVDTSTPAFSTKEVISKAAGRQQRVFVAPIARPVASQVYTQSGRAEPQPLPIKQQTSAPHNSTASRVPPIPNPSSGGNFSPFHNNLFSQATVGILGVKKEEDPRMNFASVARTGVVPNSSSYSESVTNSLSVSLAEMDPTRAPGYKAPGQRTTSPQLHDSDMSRAPGYRGPNFNPMMSAPGQQTPMSSSLDAFVNHPAYMNHPDFYRISQFRSGGMPPNAGLMMPPQSSGMPEFVKAPGFNKPLSGPPSQNMSPRSSASTALSANNQSPRSSLRASLLLRDDEYSSPHTPMTLPKIESNLNPNAPQFMSRHPGHPGIPPPHMNQPNLPMQSQIHPAFRPSYPTGPLSTQGSDINLNDLQTLLAHGGGFGVVGRPGSPSMAPGRGSHTGMQTQPPSSKDDSQKSVSNMGTGDNNSPTPSAQVGGTRGHPLATDQAGFQRPIGTERGHMRALTPNTAGLPDSLDDLGPSANLWGYSDKLSDWLTAMTTTSVVNNTVVTSERPHSQPNFNKSSGVGPGLARPMSQAGNYSLEPTILQHLEHGIQPSQRSAYNMPSQSTAFSNGIPSGLGGLPHGASVDNLPGNMWAAQQPAPKPDSADAALSSGDPKLAWNSWSQPPSNA